MVDSIRQWCTISDATAAAMRTVERHRFVPAVPPAEAYTDDTVVTRRDADDVATSSSSAPWLMALMLDQLELAPGMRVLEIGGGTGYNAGLIAELVGPGGHVTAVEIQPDVAHDARTALAITGAANTEVVCGDGEYGHPAAAPYDRIIATAGAWDIPHAWTEQLTPGGLMVVPLRMKGLTRAVALKRDDDGVWRGRSAINCGFMPIRGDGEMPEQNIRVAEDVTVRVDDGHDVDAETLRRTFAGCCEVAWTGVMTDSTLDLLDFYLADLEGFCRVLASPSIAERGLIEPMNNWGSMGTATRDAVGYLTKRDSGDPHVWELGACAYGPDAARAVTELARRIRWWGSGRKVVTGVRVEIHPPGSDDVADALMTVDKRHSRVVVRPEIHSQA